MRRSILVLLALLASFAATVHASGPPAKDREQAVVSGLPELVLTGPLSLDFIGARAGSLALADRMAHYGVPGVSVAVIAADQVAWAKGFGVLDVESGAPVTPDALFEAASTTKFVTAVAVWRLVQSGDLHFDDEANAHLKSWRIPDNEFTADRKVSIGHLLSHTAGLNRPAGGFSTNGEGTPSLIQVLKGEVPATNAPLTVTAAPGSGHDYSNFGYIVLQPLLADLLERPYPQIMADLVFSPAGMNASGFDPRTAGLGEGRSAARPRARHHGAAGEPLESEVQTNILAHGGLWTTPTDLGQLVAAVMAGHRGTGPLAECRTVIHEALRPEVDFTPDQFYGFSGQGLGVFLLDTDQGPGISHPGQNDPGATCFLFGFPATGQGAVVMTNGAQGALLSLELLSSIASAYGWPAISCE